MKFERETLSIYIFRLLQNTNFRGDLCLAKPADGSLRRLILNTVRHVCTLLGCQRFECPHRLQFTLS